ncbi:MAG: hypothetical protein ACR2JW_15585 [Thermomicrobiales bacterium]
MNGAGAKIVLDNAEAKAAGVTTQIKQVGSTSLLDDDQRCDYRPCITSSFFRKVTCVQSLYDSCYANLQSLVEWSAANPGDRNEATTRLLLIDRLFFECLGWEKDDREIILEEAYAGEYADYVFSAPRRILVVEAKKEGLSFELPSGLRGVEFSIRTLMRDYPDLRAAINQAAGYCQSRGIPFGVVSNGHQIVSFIGARNDGLPPLEGRALVFASLEKMVENFLQLWQALSRHGIEEKNLARRLIGGTLPAIPPKLSASLAYYPGTKNRNIYQANLQTVSEVVLEDIARAPEIERQFLEDCYCRSGALSQYSMLSRELLEARYAALFDTESPGPAVIPATNRDGLHADLLSEGLSRRPILLIGDVGAGKTTFIRNLMVIDAPHVFAAAISLYIDFGSQATLTRLQDFVVEELIRQLRDAHGVDVEENGFVRAVYHGQLLRFSKGIYGSLKETNPVRYQEEELKFLEGKVTDRAQYIKDALQHIAYGRSKQVVIVLDNADQREEEIQQQVFLIAQEMAAQWPALVFFALRPETFHRSMSSGALSGYHPKAFTISPPRMDLVIERRLRFALRITSGDIPLHSLSDEIRVRLRNLEAIIHVFLNSMDRSEAIIECIDNIASGNVRLGLELVQDFFGSGHVNTAKIVEIFEETHDYTVPLHEFLRAVIFGDSEYYTPERSPIVNIFDIASPDLKEHFLMSFLLSMLSAPHNAGAEEGFIELGNVYEMLQGVGFTPDQIDTCIVRAHSKKLLETAARRIPQPNRRMPQAVRVTSLGVYHLKRLSHRFSYVDAIIVDTPILDPEARATIRDPQQHLPSRLDQANAFRLYLDKAWEAVKHDGSLFDWPMVSNLLRKDLNVVAYQAERRRLRYPPKPRA